MCFRDGRSLRYSTSSGKIPLSAQRPDAETRDVRETGDLNPEMPCHEDHMKQNLPTDAGAAAQH